MRGLACRQGHGERAFVLQREGAGSEEEGEARTSGGLGGIKESMERDSDNFGDSGAESRDDGSPEFSPGEDHETVIRTGDEWFDPMWLRANGARLNEDGSVTRTGAPVLLLLASPTQTASPGEELDEVMRVFGMLAWPRHRRHRVPTLAEQMLGADRARKAWMVSNPLATLWAATARTGPRRRRTFRR